MKEFAKEIFDPKQEAFIVYITTLFAKPMKVYLDYKVQITILIADKTLITIPAEYLDFANAFSQKSTAVLPKHIEFNTYTIDFKNDKKLLYNPIYSVNSIKLETLKT